MNANNLSGTQAHQRSRCRICNSEGTHSRYVAREMMFGTREEFEYFMCAECGCLQISQVPSELGRFYPPNYYSYNLKIWPNSEISSIRKILERLRVKNALFGQGYKLARLASQLVDFPPHFSEIGPLLKTCKVQSFDARFLDVGCGSSSSWLNDLRSLGFRNLLGVDPYIADDVEENGIRILRQQLDSISGKFDVVTLHHSLEHIPDQLKTLKAVYSLLQKGGFCLVRIPLVSSMVWEEYGTDWVELDAPRHLYLHSLKSIELIANEIGFELVDRCWDSTEFEFWGSEQYRRGIPLMAEGSFSQNPSKSNFTYREMANFQKRAEEANDAGRGGRGCFFFQVTQ